MLVPSATKRIAPVSVAANQAKKDFDQHHEVKEKHFEPEETICVRTRQGNKSGWVHGTVKSRNNVMYEVEMNDRTSSRHANQLRKSIQQIVGKIETSTGEFC